MRKRKTLILLSLITLLATQFACEFVNVLRTGMENDVIGDVAGDIECEASGGTWTYDTEKTEWYCDFLNVELAPEPPLWNLPEEPESAPEVDAPAPVPEAAETIEPSECNEKASVNFFLNENASSSCERAYFIHFTAAEETILYYHTLTYVNAENPRGHWQVQRLYANQSWSWSSETIEDGVCIPTVLDQYTVFIAVEGCDNMYKRASWAIEEYAQPIAPFYE